MSDGGMLRNQYKSNRNCFEDLEVAHELGFMEVAHGPGLNVPLSRCYPEISGFRADTRQEPFAVPGVYLSK